MIFYRILLLFSLCFINVSTIWTQLLDYTLESQLATGDIYKISIEKEGIYKIDFDLLSEIIDSDPSSINIDQVQLFGHPGGALKETIAAQDFDDLLEIPIQLYLNGNTTFEQGDFLLFYAEGPDRVVYNESLNHPFFTVEKNIYDAKAYIFLKVGQTGSKKILKEEDIDDIGTDIIDESYQYERLESNSINLLGNNAATQGSGQQWFDRNLSNQRSFILSNEFQLQNRIPNREAWFDMVFAGRSAVTSEVLLNINDQSYAKEIGRVLTGDVEATFARIARISDRISLEDDVLIELSYPQISASSEGWLDYLHIEYTAKNDFIAPYISIKNPNYDADGVTSISIKPNGAQLEVWDVSRPFEVQSMTLQEQGGQVLFADKQANTKEYIAFAADKIETLPKFEGKISNQNLHAIQDAELVIVYHNMFKSAAQRLTDHRINESDINTVMLDISTIYNEFSAGKQDPTAIRNFAKMLYDRSEDFKFLLLFGDGSYDYQGLSPGLEWQSFIPAYETKESLNPLSSFPTDDYYALLSDNEGGSLRGAIDIAVGRIPVKTSVEAENMVDKIIHYETDPNRFGDWRMRVAFAADDEDGNVHLRQADDIARKVESEHPILNQEKIYFDAFIQESTPGGARYPDATEKLNNEVFKGLLVTNYLGHGGPKGWSQERVLKVSDIKEWSNIDKMPLIITATCSFTGFDDPALVTAGEEAILNPNGGAIALFSTVRSVFSNQNFRLTESVFDTIFTKDNGKNLKIGEILRRAKNANFQDTINVNARKFLLIGDPSLGLSLPQYNVKTLSINDQSAQTMISDTLKALEGVNISGEITDTDGNRITNFNGEVFVTLFDKAKTVKTLNNDPGSPVKSFRIQQNKIFNGSATVENGAFMISFTIPIDIDYNFGNGKISYYATDFRQSDASGVFRDFVIGGTNEEILEDDEGPQVQIFMNSRDFESGGITGQNPLLLVDLEDNVGINFTGTSIGHDITAILDGNTQNTMILNEFFISTKDNAKAGTISFPLSGIEPGLHSISVKAFDVANNSGASTIEFKVLSPEESVIENVFNFPNPVQDFTTFSFDHTLTNTSLDIEIEIYNISGQLIEVVKESGIYQSHRINDIVWDIQTNTESRSHKGIYLYKIKINAPQLNISTESAFEKLVIVN